MFYRYGNTSLAELTSHQQVLRLNAQENRANTQDPQYFELPFNHSKNTSLLYSIIQGLTHPLPGPVALATKSPTLVIY